MGHEFVGEVVEVGSDVRTIKVGDKVCAVCASYPMYILDIHLFSYLT